MAYIACPKCGGPGWYYDDDQIRVNCRTCGGTDTQEGMGAIDPPVSGPLVAPSSALHRSGILLILASALLVLAALALVLLRPGTTTIIQWGMLLTPTVPLAQATMIPNTRQPGQFPMRSPTPTSTTSSVGQPPTMTPIPLPTATATPCGTVKELPMSHRLTASLVALVLLAGLSGYAIGHVTQAQAHAPNIIRPGSNTCTISYATDPFNANSGPLLGKEINGMAHSTPEGAWVATGWVAVEVPQAAASGLQYTFTGKTITQVNVDAAAYLPDVNPNGQLAADPIFFQASTDHGRNWSTVPANVSAPGEVLYTGSPNSWDRFTFSGVFAQTTTDVRIFFRDVQDQGIHPYWIQAGQAAFTLLG